MRQERGHKCSSRDNCYLRKLMVLPVGWCSGLPFSGALHIQPCKCTVTVEAQSIWRANMELEALSLPLQCHLACCSRARLGLGWGRAFSQPGNSTCLLLFPSPSSISRHEWAVTTIPSPWDMFLFLIVAKAQVRRRQHKAINRAIIKAAQLLLCCSAHQAGYAAAPVPFWTSHWWYSVIVKDNKISLNFSLSLACFLHLSLLAFLLPFIFIFF